MKVQRYDIDNAGCSDALMVLDDCGCYVLHEDYAKRMAELEADCDRLRKDRYDLLGVKTKEGLGASEWMMRTATAESRVKELEGIIYDAVSEVENVGEGLPFSADVWDRMCSTLGEQPTGDVTKC